MFASAFKKSLNAACFTLLLCLIKMAFVGKEEVAVRVPVLTVPLQQAVHRSGRSAGRRPAYTG